MAASLHDAGRIVVAGTPLESARAAAILLHGRGGSAHDMLGLAELLTRDGVAFLVPQATDHTWYPQRFIAPLEANEPWLSSALGVVTALVKRGEQAGIDAGRVMLLGFSQGGCLALESATRHARRYGAVVGLSAGLIGPPGRARDDRGAFFGTPVLLGCSDIDFHIPLASVEEAAATFTRMGAVVDKRIYKGMDHTVNDDEIEAVKALLAGLVRG
jgi:predicted esterase